MRALNFLVYSCNSQRSGRADNQAFPISDKPQNDGRWAPPGSSKLVLDASAVVRIIEGSPEALVMHEAVLAADLVLAPELMLTEVANALWRLQRI